MSAKSGKRHERELARELEELGFRADRTTRSGAAGSYSVDLLIVRPQHDGAVDAFREQYKHCAIAKMVERGELSGDEVLQAEVKYKSDGSGFKGLYEAHLETVGLGTTDVLRWLDGHNTSGVYAWSRILANGQPYQIPSYVSHNDFTTKYIRSLLDGERDKAAPDVAFVRMRARPWVAVWRAM